MTTAEMAAWTAIGFGEWQTGGNCTALGRNELSGGEDGSLTYTLVTAHEDAATPESMDEPCDVGRYDDRTGDPAEGWATPRTFATARAALEWLTAEQGVRFDAASMDDPASVEW